jgi:hypothetical protein
MCLPSHRRSLGAETCRTPPLGVYDQASSISTAFACEMVRKLGRYDELQISSYRAVARSPRLRRAQKDPVNCLSDRDCQSLALLHGIELKTLSVAVRSKSKSSGSDRAGHSSWPGLSRPSTTSRHFSNNGWMPATSSGLRRRDRSP